MKKVSISRSVANAMEKSGAFFKTAEECQKFIMDGCQRAVPQLK